METRRAVIARRLLRLAVAAITLATGASHLGGLWWVLGLVVHFRPQLAAASLAAALLAALLRQPGAAALAMLLLALNAAPLAPYLRHYASAEAGTAANLRVLILNMHGSGTDHARFRRLIEAEHADLVLLTEIPGDIDDLAAESAMPPYRLFANDRSPFNVALWSRWPLTMTAIERVEGDLPVITAEICDTGRWRGCLRVVGLHAARPFAEAGRLQREQLALAARLAVAAPVRRTVLLGDLNLTPWSPQFAALLSATGLRDGGTPRGLVATWLSRLPVLGLFLDQVLVDPAIGLAGNHLGSTVGSDHFAVIADLAVPATAP